MSSFEQGLVRALLRATVGLAYRVSTDDRGVVPVSVCAIPVGDYEGEAAVSERMTGATMASKATARNKALTVLWYDCDTYQLARKLASGEWQQSDVDNARGACPFFCNWDGGILVRDQGVVVASLAVSGRTGLGDRILAVEAAHSLGYETSFGADGLDEYEVRKRERDHNPMVDYVAEIPPR